LPGIPGEGYRTIQSLTINSTYNLVKSYSIIHYHSMLGMETLQ